MRSSNIRYMPAVDHLRAYAALLILFYHGLHVFSYYFRFHVQFAPDHWLQPGNVLAAALAEGHTAVGLFMVLSGFILTHPALDDEVDARVFLRNRLLRTYPLFLLMLFAGMTTSPSAFSWSAFLQSVFGMANLPGSMVAPPFTSLLWTIGVEWQFYLLFPLLVRVLKTGWTRMMLGITAVMLVFQILATLAGGNPRDFGYFTILGRLDQFVIGMWAAWWLRAHPLSTRQGCVLAGVVGIVITATLTAFNAVGGWPLLASWKVFWPTFEGILWAAFVVGYVAAANASRGRWSRWTARIGEISYSMYLLHFTFIFLLVKYGLPVQFSGHLVVDAVLNTLLIALPSTLAVSALTYRFVELPFLRLRGRYHRETAPT